MMGLQHCPMARYLKFHSHHGGIAKTGRTVPLATGTYIHKALENVLSLGAATLTRMLTTKLEDFIPIVEKAAIEYLLEADSKGFTTTEDSHTKQEQAHLIQALTFGWIAHVLPYILENFDIIQVEKEVPFKIDFFTQLQRPDLVLRAKSTRRFGSLDFKSESSIRPGYENLYRENLQLSLQCLGPSLHLGVDVQDYYVNGLLKGRRDYFERPAMGMASAGKRQYSDLCYATIRSSSPFVWDLKGWWIDKVPIWEIEFPPCSGCSLENKAFHWVYCCLPPAAVKAMFAFVGPFQRNDTLINQYCAASPLQELYWYSIEERALHSQDTYGWESDEHQKFIDTNIPRSYRCQEYFGGKCEFYELCFKLPGWKDPFSIGFEKRVPHHEGEKL